MADIQVINDMTIVLLVPQTPRAVEWLKTHLETEPWQWLGIAVAIDPRYVQDVLNGAEEDGLEIE